MRTINVLGEENSLDDFDVESYGQLVGLRFLNLNKIDFDGIQNGFNNAFQEKSVNKGFEETTYENK